MPDPKEYTDEKEWMGACVPRMMTDKDYPQDQAVAACMNMWREKSANPGFILTLDAIKAYKAGRRHSDSDHKHLTNAIEEIVQAGGDHPSFHPSEVHEQPLDPDKSLVHFGQSVKAVKLDDGTVKLAGYLVTFSDQDTPDLTGDYFTNETDFGEAVNSDSWFNHRMPIAFGGKSMEYKERLPKTTLRKDDMGVFAEIILGARNDYEKAIAEAGLAGKLGWSSGTASHLVEKKWTGKAWEIEKWPLGLDASLTPTPAEPRNSVVPLKSLLTPALAVTSNGENKLQSETNTQGVNAMEDKELEALMHNVATEAANTAATEAVKKANQPEVNPGFAQIAVTKDAADKPFTSAAEQLRAVKNFTASQGQIRDPRLMRMAKLDQEWKAATGASEGIPSDGGYLLEPTLTASILKPLHEVGPFTSAVNKLPVGSNSNYGWINGVDETSRADGSRWGGVQGYWLEEAGTKTASQPKFRRLNWELHKVAALLYATDELLQDTSQMDAIINQSAAEELSFKANDAILNGNGAGKPLGILAAPVLVTPVRVNATTIINADLLNMWVRMLPTSRANAVWYIGVEAEPQLDQLYLTSTLEARYITYGADSVMRIKGRPVVVTEFNAALGTLGDICLFDMSEYLWWEKSVQSASSIHVQFLTDQTCFRFVYRCDGKPSNYTPITPYKSTSGATLSSFVALSASS